MKGLEVFLVFLAFIADIGGYRILSVFPTSCKSHWMIGKSVMKTLAMAGHEVHVISPFSINEKIENYNEIIVENGRDDDQPNIFDTQEWSPIEMMHFLSGLGEFLANSTLNHPNVQSLLNKKTHFDAVVVEVFWVEALYGLGAHFNCPVIALSTFSTSKWTNDLTKAPSPYSYIAHNFMKVSEDMNFYERTLNTLTSQYENVFFELVHYRRQEKVFAHHFHKTGRTFVDQMKNVSLVFINHHFSTSSIRPIVANMIEIGGIHVEPAKPLPTDIKSFLDSAEHGAILFSMGSIIQGKDWNHEKREAFVRAFKKLKLKVLWKYENETLPNKPENVMISPWIPQRDILAHPNVKLFITHGGLLGTTEALVEGVPVLGIPIYADQKMNMLKAEQFGYGILMELDDITESLIDKNLQKILSNSEFKKNSQEISSRYNDRPMTPQQLTVYWVEYVIRHNGAPQLRSPAHNLNYVQLNLIDVYSFLVASLVLLIFVATRAWTLMLERLSTVFIDKKEKHE